MITKLTQLSLVCLVVVIPLISYAQESDPADNNETDNDATELLIEVNAGPTREALVGQPINFNLITNPVVDKDRLSEVLWSFGDGVRITGSNVTHTFTQSGSYNVTLNVTTPNQQLADTTEIRVFEHVAILASDNSASADEIALHKQKAAEENTLLISLRSKEDGPDVLTEEALSRQLIDVIPTLKEAQLIIMWTSGGVGANALTKLAQHIRQSDDLSSQAPTFTNKGIILLSDTPFGVLAPTAQSAFDQLQPSYVILARPGILDLVTVATTAEEARNSIISSPLEYRVLGTFSSRTVSDLRFTNALSFGINFLVNRGVPINSIILILMLPIIATILAFARQVIGIKAFGLVTPAMTTVSFLVMGLQYGLIIFVTILLAGTLTRLILRKLRLLYLPRMALVLTSVSFSLLLLLGLGAANDRSSILSFSIFPALILTILAEEFISAQFKHGLRNALTITGWTLVLAMSCYAIVSSEIFRTLILSYPETILATIPINIILGQWSGLRLTEYFRFRTLLRHGKRIT